ncbi:peroxiredoxin-like family protein [Sneathiella limimaris]|uniref:peroxiredoxin-like family protein n=1 Tax=Sneathiella limimaris TaxID=1964213 RepID=UPI00146D1D49|nr:peroxiredoxin-like family protein [Sneathiella limimaris]
MSSFEEISCITAPLPEKLSRYEQVLAGRAPNLASLYADLIQRLEQTNAGADAPMTGDNLPDFLLPDQNGRLMSLEKLTASGPLVLSFNRGHWCSFCRLELLAYQAAYPRIRELGANVISILPETAAYSRRLAEDLDLPFPLLSDMDNAYALSLGLMIPIGEMLKEAMLACGTNLANSQKNAGWFVPIPATYVIDRNGKVIVADVDPDFRKRLDVERVITALERQAS